MKIFITVLAVIGIFVGVAACNMGGSIVGSITGIFARTIAPDNVIHNYEWFKMQCGAIKAFSTKIDIARRTLNGWAEIVGDRKDMTFEDKQEDSRLRSIVQGLESQLASMIQEYDAKAQMMNRAIFNTGTSCDQLP